MRREKTGTTTKLSPAQFDQRLQDHYGAEKFIEDGVISQEHWEEAPRKILFVLKEGYNPDGSVGGWDLRKDVRDDPGLYGTTLREAAYWAYGLLQADTDAASRLDQIESVETVRESFLSTAVINVNKRPSHKTSDLETIRETTRGDLDLIRDQIDWIDPRIVVCGSTWSLISDLWDDPQEVYQYVHKVEERFFVDFWHPANRFPRALNYYALITLLKSARAFDKPST